jgi:peptidoglycan biosynthesis protein MviN/MurJ (putative lipid II flippase)
LFALRDTATPARAAVVRVAVALAVGALLMVQFEPVTVLGVTIPAGVLGSFDADGVPLGPLGLAGGAAVGAWVEWWQLRRRLAGSLGDVGAGASLVLRLLAAAIVAAAAGRGIAAAVPLDPLPLAAIVAAAFGAVYCALALVLRVPEARALVGGLRRRLRLG